MDEVGDEVDAKAMEALSKVEKYLDELETRPLWEVLEEVREEDEVLKQTFVSFLIYLMAEEVGLSYGALVLVLEQLKFEVMSEVSGRVTAIIARLLERARRR